MSLRRMGVLGLGLIVAGPAAAQNFTNTIFFGDSNTDSGRYHYIPRIVGNPASIANPGAYTTNFDPMWSVLMGQHFGIAVTPSDAPSGGNNYAAGGARVVFENPLNNAWSATSQINAYLASTGGRADPNALFAVYIGINDLKPTTAGGPGPIVNPTNVAAITTLAVQQADLVTKLAGAGARYILVPNTASAQNAAVGAASGFGYSAAVTASRALYDQVTYNTLAARGVNFIPADISSIYNYVLLNPAMFGITVTNVNTPACGATVGSINCTPANYVTPNANRTYFYADGPLAATTGVGQLSGAMQQVQADYYYSLIVPPSQISFLAEAPV